MGAPPPCNIAQKVQIVVEYFREFVAPLLQGNLVFNLRAKLDAAGHYDDFEVDRVVEAELKGAKQSELVAAITPVEDRLMKRYKAAQEALKTAKDKNDEAAIKTAQDELNALILRTSWCM